MSTTHRYSSRSFRRQLALVAGVVSVVTGLMPVTGPTLAGAAPAAPGIITTTVAGLSAPVGLVKTAAGMDVSVAGSGVVRPIDAAGNAGAPIAGGGAPPESPDGTLATRAVLPGVTYIALGPRGDVYYADQTRVRKVDGTTGRLVTVAGTGVAGFSGDGGPATQAQLNFVRGLAVDAQGNLFIADARNSRIREVDPSGTIRTVAGTGVFGSAGDGGPATAAQVAPDGLALDAAGDLFFTSAQRRVRRIDAASQIVTTVAGNGQFGYGGAGDGGPAVAASFAGATGIYVDPSGTTLIITDSNDRRIRQVSGGIITTVAGGGLFGNYGDGGAATAAFFSQPFQAVLDPGGNLLLSDNGFSTLRRVDKTTGIITTIAGTPGNRGLAGDGRAATNAQIGYPSGLALDAAGDLFLGDQYNNRIREIDPSGVITSLAGGSAGDGVAATSAALRSPYGLALATSGDLLVADCGDSQVRRVDSAGVITVFAGEGSGRSGIGDGGAATDAVLDCPAGLALAPPGGRVAAGTVYIADCPANRVRAVDPAGRITTVAGNGAAGFAGDRGAAVSASLNCPEALATDAAGDLYIADDANNRVRMVDTRGVITTVAGDGVFGIGDDGVKAVASHVGTPTALALDGAGNLFISDGARIRRVSAASPRIITTVAGSGIPGFSGDGGPAVNSQLSNPNQMLVGPNGDVTVADTGNNRIRTITAGTPAVPAAGCGAVVTTDVRLTADLGPCPGDGLVAGADGIVINLNGHTIRGTGPGANRAGIRLAGRHHVVVTGLAHPAAPDGQITGFEDGVAIIGGSNNTVQHVSIHDNVGGDAEFGDGIGIFASAGNTIASNTLDLNGPYDGIGVLGQGSDSNVIQGNSVSNTRTYPDGFGCDGTGLGIIITSFLDVTWPRKVTIAGNQVIGNTITGNDTAGISDIGNLYELIQGNTVTGNGIPFPCPGNGIGLQNTLLNGVGSHATIRDNQVHGNGTNGIEIDTNDNTIVNNNAADNNVDDDGYTDLADYSAVYPATGCSRNVWSGNVWGAGGYWPDCTTAGGTGPNPPAAAAATSPTSGAGTSTAAPHGHGAKQVGTARR